MEPKSVNVTADQITGGSKLLRTFERDSEKLTDISVISNLQPIPESTETVKYETLALDQFIGEKVAEWDGHSPLTLYFNSDGVFDHATPTGTGTAAGASAT